MGWNARHERGNVREADAAREPGQDVGEVLDGVEVGERAAAQDRVGDGRAFPAGIAAREEKVLDLMDFLWVTGAGERA